MDQEEDRHAGGKVGEGHAQAHDQDVFVQGLLLVLIVNLCHIEF